MSKQRIEHETSVDALIALTKRLSLYEAQYSQTSEEFYNAFSQGEMEDSADFVEWGNDYENYLVLRREIEGHLRHAA